MEKAKRSLTEPQNLKNNEQQQQQPPVKRARVDVNPQTDAVVNQEVAPTTAATDNMEAKCSTAATIATTAATSPKKKKKKKFSSILSGMMHKQTKPRDLQQEREALRKVLGGGNFIKVDKI
jgi:hypothetical protein